MTYEEADELLQGQSFSKYSEVRELLVEAAGQAIAKERHRCKIVVQMNQVRDGHQQVDGQEAGTYLTKMVAEIEHGTVYNPKTGRKTNDHQRRRELEQAARRSQGHDRGRQGG